MTGRPLRIGIDAHAIGERKTGNERFIANLIPALRRLCDHEMVLYFTDAEAAAAWPPAVRTEARVLRPGHRLVRIPLTLPYRAARDRLDVLLVQYTGPPVIRCPVVTVVHDVGFARLPQFYTRAERIWMKRTIPLTMLRAAGVITVSEFSKEEIVGLYAVPRARVTVAHNGVAPAFSDGSRRAPSIDPPFFLSVGNLQPRKNLPTLVRGYRSFLERRPEAPERLVVVGQPWFEAETLHRETVDLRASGRLLFTGYVADEDLVGLLQGATAFAYPSVYEGFGLPPIEAMAAGAPTLVSDIPVMREVLGDSALRLPPSDSDAWAGALDRVSSDAGLRARLTEAGRARAARYTWEACARQVLSVLEGAAATGRR